MSTKAIKPVPEEEEYVSGEQYKFMSQSRQASNAHRVTMTMPSTPSLLTAIIVIILCGLSFLGGLSYQKHHGAQVAATSSASSRSGSGGFTGGRRRSGGFGQVTAVSSTSITITNQRTNANTTYSISGSTTITDNGQTVTASDIQTGDTVIIMTSGSTSTAASSILVNPSFGGGGGGGFGGNGTSAPVDPDNSAITQSD